MASEIQQSSDLWDLEYYLTERRKEIDRKYNFRGSRLPDVLGKLLYENRLGEEDLRGLREEKMKSIRSFAQFLTADLNEKVIVIHSEDYELIARLAFVRQPSEQAPASTLHFGNIDVF